MSFTTSKTTPHKSSCNMAFGRKDKTCDRCVELLNGAKPITWALSQKKQAELVLTRAIRKHDCKVSNCGVMCTAFDY